LGSYRWERGGMRVTSLMSQLVTIICLHFFRHGNTKTPRTFHTYYYYNLERITNCMYLFSLYREKYTTLNVNTTFIHILEPMMTTLEVHTEIHLLPMLLLFLQSGTQRNLFISTSSKQSNEEFWFKIGMRGEKKTG